MSIKPKVNVIAHNIRSSYNVGAIFRTCEAVGVNTLYLTGYTPFPRIKNDKRLDFEIEKQEKKIKKTGLDGFNNLPFEHIENILDLIQTLKKKGYKIVALEQDKNSTNIYDFKNDKNITIIIGNEVTGLEQEVLDLCNEIVEIPMFGKGKSLNVGVSLGVGLYLINQQV